MYGYRFHVSCDPFDVFFNIVLILEKPAVVFQSPDVCMTCLSVGVCLQILRRCTHFYTILVKARRIRRKRTRRRKITEDVEEQERQEAKQQQVEQEEEERKEENNLGRKEGSLIQWACFALTATPLNILFFPLSPCRFVYPCSPAGFQWWQCSYSCSDHWHWVLVIFISMFPGNLYHWWSFSLPCYPGPRWLRFIFIATFLIIKWW